MLTLFGTPSNEKVAIKYGTKALQEAVRAMLGVRSVSAESIPVGARGAILSSKKLYCGIKLTRNQLATLSQVAIKGSIYTFTTFMKA